MLIRAGIYTIGFAAVTAGLVWGLSGPANMDLSGDEVSRADPSAFDLAPALPPAQTPMQGGDVTQGPSEVGPTPAPTVLAQTNTDPVQESVRQITEGIVQALKTPPGQSPAPPPEIAPAAPQAPVTADTDATALQAALTRSLRELPQPAQTQARTRQDATQATAPEEGSTRYTVQEGDSLAGIAFDHYGSTAGFFMIMSANADQLTSPADLRAGMVLTLPPAP